MKAVTISPNALFDKIFRLPNEMIKTDIDDKPSSWRWFLVKYAFLSNNAIENHGPATPPSHSFCAKGAV